MTQGQLIALFGGAIAVVVGAAFVLRRDRFAEYCANRNPVVPLSMRGHPFPLFIACTGALLILSGLGLLLGSFTGALR